MFLVFEISFTSIFTTFFLCFTGLSRLIRLSLNAFSTTHTLERLIAAAPHMGFSVTPSGENTPAAMGMHTTL